jgi:hypothetical protein
MLTYKRYASSRGEKLRTACTMNDQVVSSPKARTISFAVILIVCTEGLLAQTLVSRCSKKEFYTTSSILLIWRAERRREFHVMNHPYKTQPANCSADEHF